MQTAKMAANVETYTLNETRQENGSPSEIADPSLLERVQDLQNRLQDMECQLHSKMEESQTLREEIKRLETHWQEEKEELVSRQKALEKELEDLRSQLNGFLNARNDDGGSTDQQTKPTATSGDEKQTTVESSPRRIQKQRIRSVGSSETYDFNLIPIIAKCLIAMSRISNRRRIDSAVVFIQRVYRGYVVRKWIKDNHGLTFNISRFSASVGAKAESPCDPSSDSVFANELPEETRRSEPDLSASGSLDDIRETNNFRSSTEDNIGQVPDSNRMKLRKTMGLGIFGIGGHHQSKQQLQRKRESFPNIECMTSTSATLLATKRSSWSVSSTSEWQGPAQAVVRDERGLKQLQNFISTKIPNQKETSGTKTSVSDIVFWETLKELHSQLTNQLPGAEDIVKSYKDLMGDFDKAMKVKVEQQQQPSAIDTQVLNISFRAVLDEFLKKKLHKELPDVKVKKENQKNKRRKGSSQETQDGGTKSKPSTVVGNGSAIVRPLEDDRNAALRSLSLTTATELINRLAAAIEDLGVQTVGIYRKAGHAGKIKQLIECITTSDPPSDVDLSDREIHVMTSVLKSILREMPKPLLTFTLYEDFIRVPDITDESERSQCLENLQSKLPQPNRIILERVIGHLAKVAAHESANRMSANGLAIVFAPCVFRHPDERCERSSAPQAFDQREHLNKQAACLQLLIETKLPTIITDGVNNEAMDTESFNANHVDNTANNDAVSTAKNHEKLETISDTEVSEPNTDTVQENNSYKLTAGSQKAPAQLENRDAEQECTGDRDTISRKEVFLDYEVYVQDDCDDEDENFLSCESEGSEEEINPESNDS